MFEKLPFGAGPGTTVYLGLYLATFVLHAVFMCYVLAGSAYLATILVFPGPDGARRDSTPFASTIRDWLPFALGAAITAGVAPLLFVQVLYQKAFYTANLLLFPRWLAVIPALVLGFYLLYLIRQKPVGTWPLPARIPVALGPLACFGFTGYSWSENHLVSLREADWPALYASGAVFPASAGAPARFAVAFALTWPILALLVSLQLWLARRERAVPPTETRRAAILALLGLAAVSICVGLFRAQVAVVAPRALWLAGAGGAGQALTWIAMLRRGRLTGAGLLAASLGGGAMLVAVAQAREAFRIAAVGVERVVDGAGRAAGAEGLPLFVFFLGLNAALIVACIVIVRRGSRPPPADLARPDTPGDCPT